MPVDRLPTLPAPPPAHPGAAASLHRLQEGIPLAPSAPEGIETPRDAAGAFPRPPAAPSDRAACLRSARRLSLVLQPASPAARALAAELAAVVLATERTTRKRRRGTQALRTFEVALGAIVGGLLRNWARTPPCPSHRSLSVTAFKAGALVGGRQFAAVMDALVAAGFVATAESVRWTAPWGDAPMRAQGLAARFWPTAALLDAAERHCLAPGTMATDFEESLATPAPAVPAPVEVCSLRIPPRNQRTALPLATLGRDAGSLLEGVEEANAFAAEHEVRGCTPPRWKRVFLASPFLGGRWIAVGAEGSYQNMSALRRLGEITIDGEPVAEIDIQASHLSIMHGLLGLPLPEGDPYQIPNHPRGVVKAWITATLGKGCPVTRWSPKALAADPGLAAYDPKDIRQAVCGRYPFLRRPAQAVLGPAGLNRLAHIGTPERLLTHRLAAIEAEALGGVMTYLRQAHGILGLPIHDSLLVPLTGLGHVRRGFDGAFGHVAKLRVQLKLGRILDGAMVKEPLRDRRRREDPAGPGTLQLLPRRSTGPAGLSAWPRAAESPRE